MGRNRLIPVPERYQGSQEDTLVLRIQRQLVVKCSLATQYLLVRKYHNRAMDDYRDRFVCV